MSVGRQPAVARARRVVLRSARARLPRRGRAPLARRRGGRALPPRRDDDAHVAVRAEPLAPHVEGARSGRANQPRLPRLFQDAATSSRGSSARRPRICASRPSRTTACRRYGMDPYVLFLAQRRSATPYIYAYDLNADAALAGGNLPARWASTRARARPRRSSRLRAAHEADFFARLKAAPPAAFVFHDKAPLITWQEAVHDFQEHCPEPAAWVLCALQGDGELQRAPHLPAERPRRVRSPVRRAIEAPAKGRARSIQGRARTRAVGPLKRASDDRASNT